MKTHLFTAILLSAGPSSFGDTPAGGSIRFATPDKDKLTGAISEIGKDEIIWNSPLLEKPSPFLLNRVVEITQSAVTPDSEANHETVVTLTNGDTLHGQLSSVTDQTIELNTWYAGKISLNRLMVESVKVIDRPKIFFRGPDSLDGWTRTGNQKDHAWTYEDGRFVSHAAGGISRDLNLPEVCKVSFDLHWKSRLRLRLISCSDSIDQEAPPNAFELVIQQRYLYLRKRWRADNRSEQNIIGPSQNVSEFMENEKARIEFCIDRKNGVFNLIVDGKSVGIWNDNEPKVGTMGGGLHFITEDNNGGVSISRIEITPWDGVVEQVPDPEDPNLAERQAAEEREKKEKEAAGGRMTLRNGDTLAGEVLGIHDGLMKVKTAFTEIDLPISRLKNISLKPVSQETAMLKNGDVRAWFPDGSRVIFRLDSSTADTLTGFSQNFGTATFRRSAFSRIEFNLYSPEFQALRGEKSW